MEQIFPSIITLIDWQLPTCKTIFDDDATVKTLRLLMEIFRHTPGFSLAASEAGRLQPAVTQTRHLETGRTGPQPDCRDIYKETHDHISGDWGWMRGCYLGGAIVTLVCGICFPEPEKRKYLALFNPTQAGRLQTKPGRSWEYGSTSVQSNRPTCGSCDQLDQILPSLWALPSPASDAWVIPRDIEKFCVIFTKQRAFGASRSRES